jgi:hypothetical protein
MKSHQRVTLELPDGGTGRDYAGAIAQAIAEANYCGDLNGAAALAGLMSAIKLPARHNPEIELGPWLANIA